MNPGGISLLVTTGGEISMSSLKWAKCQKEKKEKRRKKRESGVSHLYSPASGYYRLQKK